MISLSSTIVARIVTYQLLCGRLDALEAYRSGVSAQVPPALRDGEDTLSGSLRLVREARIARFRLRDALRLLVADAIRDGEPRAALVDRVRDGVHALMIQRTLRPDAALVDEIASWVIEAYPGERSKADYVEVT
jgi:hypothetical protein